MFADCFITPAIAVALRAANFDEPCMALHEIYEYNGKQHSKFQINYSNHPSDPSLYNSTLQEIIIEHPNILRTACKNSELPPWRYSAPLYDQVHDWFFIHGLRIHDCFVAHTIYSKGSTGAWICHIYENKTGNSLWPLSKLMSSNKYYNTRREAWDDAIIYGLKILTNGNTVDV